jgi:hypothetical protein
MTTLIGRTYPWSSQAPASQNDWESFNESASSLAFCEFEDRNSGFERWIDRNTQENQIRAFKFHPVNRVHPFYQ